MAGERAQQIRKAGEDATNTAARNWQESGELRHLYGRPLDLADDSPDWLLHQILKQQGFSLPLIERGKDLDEAQARADAIVERLRRRRSWLIRPQARCRPEQARAFNETRLRALDAYRGALAELNRAILDFNLTAPPSLQRRGFLVDQVVARVAQEIPPLEGPAPDPAPTSSRLRAAWRRLRGGRV